MCHEVQGKRCTSRRECNKKDNGTSISANFFGRWNEVKPVNQIGSGEGLDEMPSRLIDTIKKMGKYLCLFFPFFSLI